MSRTPIVILVGSPLYNVLWRVTFLSGSTIRFSSFFMAALFSGDRLGMPSRVTFLVCQCDLALRYQSTFPKDLWEMAWLLWVRLVLFFKRVCRDVWVLWKSGSSLSMSDVWTERSSVRLCVEFGLRSWWKKCQRIALLYRWMCSLFFGFCTGLILFILWLPVI